MKKSILNLVGCFAFFSAISQPTITDIHWGKIKRDRYFESTQNISPNPVAPGNGVIWDFTNLTALPGDSSSLTGKISVSPYDTFYPKANIVFMYDTDPFPVLSYKHYYKDSSEFSYLGQKTIGSKPQIYGIPKKLLKFPMVFNSSFLKDIPQ